MTIASVEGSATVAGIIAAILETLERWERELFVRVTPNWSVEEGWAHWQIVRQTHHLPLADRVAILTAMHAQITVLRAVPSVKRTYIANRLQRWCQELVVRPAGSVPTDTVQVPLPA